MLLARGSLISSTGVLDAISTRSGSDPLSDDQPYDSRSFWSPGTYSVHELMSIFRIVSLGQHFVTLTPPKPDTGGQDAHAPTNKTMYANADIILLRRCHRPEMDHRRSGEVSHCVRFKYVTTVQDEFFNLLLVRIPASTPLQVLLVLLHHNPCKTKKLIYFFYF